MALSREEVLKVATLSRIRLTGGEEERFATQLSAILEYVDKLRGLDTEAVEPLAHALPIHNVLRPDEPRPSLAPNQALGGVGRKITGITKRRFHVNLQPMRVTLPNGTPARVRVCVQCLRSGRVQKRIKRLVPQPAQS